MPTDGTTSLTRRIGSMLLSAPVGLLAASIVLAILMGCMSLSIGNRTVETPTVEEGVLWQQGEAQVSANSSVFVHYPLSYPRTPNLEICCTFDDCVIEREDKDGFLLKNPNSLSRKVKWKARGPRCEPSAALPIPAPAENPPTALPATPVPLHAPTPERGP
jgi:hypothetical protein